MAISRKLKPEASEDAGVDIQALIYKGGDSVAGEGTAAGRQKLMPVMLRLPSMLEKVVLGLHKGGLGRDRLGLVSGEALARRGTHPAETTGRTECW